MFLIKDIEDVKFIFLEMEGFLVELECFLDRIGEVGVLWVLISFIEIGYDGYGIWLCCRNFGVFGVIGVKCICVVYDFGWVGDFWMVE